MATRTQKTTKEELTPDNGNGKKKTFGKVLKITLNFPGRLFSQTPKDPDVVKSMLEARKPGATPPNQRTIENISEEVVSTLASAPTPEEDIQKISLGFQYPNGAVHMRGSTFRSHLKDCSRIVGRMHVGKIEGEASLGWKITNGLYVLDYWIPVTRPDGSLITLPDGAETIFVHATGPRGPVNSVKIVDWVSDVCMSFRLWVFNTISISDIEMVMTYGAIHGYAGERSMGEGRYIFEIEDITDTTPMTKELIKEVFLARSRQR